MKQQQIYNLIILDESGSMQSIKHQTVNGFNEVVQTIKGVGQRFPEQEHYISLITFNTFGINTHLFNSPVKVLKEISHSGYQPSAATPLYDAMGSGIKKQRDSIQENPSANVLVTVITDGEENSSREFTGKAVKTIIEELKQLNWTFTYIGANHDVEKFSRAMAIDNMLMFKSDALGTSEMFVKESKARFSYSLKIRNKKNPKEGYFTDVDNEELPADHN